MSIKSSSLRSPCEFSALGPDNAYIACLSPVRLHTLLYTWFSSNIYVWETNWVGRSRLRLAACFWVAIYSNSMLYYYYEAVGFGWHAWKDNYEKKSLKKSWCVEQLGSLKKSWWVHQLGLCKINILLVLL